MTKAQQDSKVRNWKIFRIRGAYALRKVLSDDRAERLAVLLDEELTALGAKTEAALREERIAKYSSDVETAIKRKYKL